MRHAEIVDLKVWVFNTEDSEISRDSSFEEMAQAIKDEDGQEYDLGQYFEHQNDDYLGLHWSILVNTQAKVKLNGLYNTQIQYVKD